MRLFLSALAITGALLFAPGATAQALEAATGLGSTINPAVTGDSVTHHHKAYPKTAYGISCPGDRVVWVNTNSGVYHLEGERWFGRTKSGAYECEKAARGEGDRETRNGQ